MTVLEPVQVDQARKIVGLHGYFAEMNGNSKCGVNAVKYHF